MNLELLKALKSAGRRMPKAETITPEQQAEMDALGLATERDEPPPRVATETLASLKGKSSVERNCGTCARWLNCTKLHAAHKVSPTLSACSGYERKV